MRGSHTWRRVSHFEPVRSDREIWNNGRYPGVEREGPDDVDYLLALIDDARTRLPIDPRRVYTMGMSNGATMAPGWPSGAPDDPPAGRPVHRSGQMGAPLGRSQRRPGRTRCGNVPPDTVVHRWRGDSPAADVVFYAVPRRRPHVAQQPPVPATRALRSNEPHLDATRVIWEFLATHGGGRESDP